MVRGQGQLLRMLAIAVMAAASLVLPGCGEDNPSEKTTAPGELAALAPSGSVLYAEALLRPEGEIREQIEAFAAGVSGENVDIEQLLETGIDEFFASTEATEEYSFRKHVEPWLGDRVALWFSSLGAADGATQGAVAIALSDADAAREMLKKESPDAEPLVVNAPGEHPDVFGDGDTAYSVFDDALIIGTPDAVLEAAESDDTPGLRSMTRFENALGEVEGKDPALFAYTLLGRVFLASVNSEAGFTVSPEQAEDWLAESGFDIDEPSLTTLDVTGNSAVFETEIAVNERPDLAATESLLETLPEDAWLAAADNVQVKIFMEAFELGTEIGLRQLARQRDISVDAARDLLTRRLGSDVVAGMNRLEGPVAVGIEGSAPLALLGTLVAPVADYGRLDDPLLAAAAMLDIFLGNRVRYAPPRPFPAGAYASVLGDLPGDEPIGMRISETRDELIVQAAGPSAPVPPGLTPERTTEDSERLRDARAALPDDYRVMGFVDVDEMLDVFPGLDEGDERFGNALENLELRFGARVQGDRYIQRFQLDVERAAAGEEDALERGNGDEDEDGEAPGLDDGVS